MTGDEFFRYAFLALPAFTFGACLWYAGEMPPKGAAFMAVILVAFGIAVHLFGVLVHANDWHGLRSFLVFELQSLSQGSDVVAIGYGMAIYAVYRLLFKRV